MDDSRQPRIERVDVSKIKPSPIQHETLSPELLREIQALYGTVGKYVSPTLEQWEIGFMRDAQPWGEVWIWKAIAGALAIYCRTYHGGNQLPDSEAESIVGNLTIISMGVTDASSLKQTEQTAARLVECYHKSREELQSSDD